MRYEIIIREWDFSQGIPVLTNQDRTIFNSKDVADAYVKTMIMKYEHEGYSCRHNKIEKEHVWVCDSQTKKIIIRAKGWF